MRPGDRIQNKRMELNLSQKEFCVLTGIPKQTMSRIENNESEISFERLIKISECLKVSIDWIVNGNEMNRIDYKFQSLRQNDKELLEPMIDKMLENYNKGLSSGSMNGYEDKIS